MRIGPLGLVYLVIGIIVAAMNDYFDSVGSARRIGEALLAVLLWPLVLLGIDINLREPPRWSRVRRDASIARMNAGRRDTLLR